MKYTTKLQNNYIINNIDNKFKLNNKDIKIKTDDISKFNIAKTPVKSKRKILTRAEKKILLQKRLEESKLEQIVEDQEKKISKFITNVSNNLNIDIKVFRKYISDNIISYDIINSITNVTKINTKEPRNFTYMMLSNSILDKNNTRIVNYSTFFTKDLPKKGSFDSSQFVNLMRTLDIEEIRVVCLTTGTNNNTDILIGSESPVVHFVYKDIKDFFNMDYLEKIIEKLDHNKGNCLVIKWENIPLSYIKFYFRLYNINLSAGNNTYKHILSKSQFTLSAFLISLGHNINDILHSYYYMSKNKSLTRSIYDFTSVTDSALLKNIEEYKDIFNLKNEDIVKIRNKLNKSINKNVELKTKNIKKNINNNLKNKSVDKVPFKNLIYNECIKGTLNT